MSAQEPFSWLPADRPRTACTPVHVTALTDLIHTAHLFTTAGDEPPCLPDILRLLDALDPATVPDSPAVIHAVVAYVEDSDFTDELKCGWLAYAYHAAARLFGPDHAMTGRAVDAYAGTLAAAGRDGEALPVHYDRVGFHRRAGDIPALLHARTDYADALHATGCCHETVTEITQVWDLWRHDWRSASWLGPMILNACLRILTGCQRTDDARTVLAQAPYRVALDLTRRPAHDAKLVAYAAAHTPMCTLGSTLPIQQVRP